MTENELSKIVVDSAFRIHKIIGPGLFESVYEEVLSYELTKQGLQIQRQKLIGITYDEIKLDLGFKADIIVNDKLIIEIKSIETIAYVHQKQLLTYLRLTNMKLGLLINFNVGLIKDGIHRIINTL
ncbi:MAG TPA: GxxExxY protein [Cyclobacteriaceae bacterium]|nr:GxxExxY protein [Cyclobacteriaceae bacterium]